MNASDIKMFKSFKVGETINKVEEDDENKPTV